MSGNRKQGYLQHKKYNMSIIKELFNILAPHECLGCNTEGNLLCERCSRDLLMIPERCYLCKRWNESFLTCPACRKKTPLHKVWTVTKYEGLAKLVLHDLKFARAQAAAEDIAAALAARISVRQETVVTHVPTAPQRVRQRGYDQAALIAKSLARQLGLPYLPLLVRSGTQRQLGQHRDVRKQQMTDAFRVATNPMLAGKHILLVDDVLTTGATCESAARVLRHAGAKRVSAAVFAVA